MTAEASPALPLRTLALYGLPALPLAALTLPLYLVVPTFWAEAMGLQLASIGAILLAIRLFDAVNDPLIGWAADRWPARNRRKAWLAAGAIPAVVACWALFWPPPGAGAAWLAASAAALSIGYTALVLPLSAWGAELSGNYDERSRIVAWREGFVVAGTLLAISLPFAIGWKDPAGLHGLALVAIMVAVLLPLAALAAIAFVPEPKTPATGGHAGLLSGLEAMQGNQHFVRLVGAFFVNSLANALPATLFLLYAGRLLGADAARGPLLMLYFACAVAGMPLWNWLAKRWGKNRAWSLAMLASCALFLPAAFLGEGDVAAFAAICVLTGLCLGADLVLPSSMQADVIETDRLATGQSRAAFFFSAWSLATKGALALAVGIAFPLLDWAGFSAAGDGREGMWALAALYAAAPVALKLVAIAMMWSFPLDAAELDRLRREAAVSRGAAPSSAQPAENTANKAAGSALSA